MKYGNFIRRGVEYTCFSVEKASEGGWSQHDLKQALKEVGIKYTMTDYMGRKAYSGFVGQWAIWIEEEYSDEVSEWLWGSGKLVGRTKPKGPSRRG